MFADTRASSSAGWRRKRKYADPIQTARSATTNTLTSARNEEREGGERKSLSSLPLLSALLPVPYTALPPKLPREPLKAGDDDTRKATLVATSTTFFLGH